MVNVTIRGTSELLLHRYAPDTVSNPKTRNTVVADYSDEWVKGTYFTDSNDKGNVILPWQNIMASIFDGAKGERMGKIYLTRVVHTSLKVLTPENEILINGEPVTKEMIENKGWLHFSGAVVSGRRVDRTRTKLPTGWECSFDFNYSEPFKSQTARAMIENAGSRAGIGDWRPSSPKKPGPYGTFEVIKFN